MAGLCEGGNEPPGSLKAISNFIVFEVSIVYLCDLDFYFHDYSEQNYSNGNSWGIRTRLRVPMLLLAFNIQSEKNIYSISKYLFSGEFAVIVKLYRPYTGTRDVTTDVLCLALGIRDFDGVVCGLMILDICTVPQKWRHSMFRNYYRRESGKVLGRCLDTLALRCRHRKKIAGSRSGDRAGQGTSPRVGLPLRVYCHSSTILFKKNSREFHEKPVHNDRVTVWCAVARVGILDPYFFEEDGVRVTVNSQRYTFMSNNFLAPRLNALQIDQRCIFVILVINLVTSPLTYTPADYSFLTSNAEDV
ncbi:hypothetical protein ANN_06870 [Periplaneta americana]|uniref:Uncharacterized protein n=1 Tax=Periplaneta americana TaxID=6978 RepID=A0ABQ8TG23_PERAM|nr:hypothetical protein ANN_06870 [Periplaneta americana]